MNSTVNKHNYFYKTFSTFISPDTKTAEKTLKHKNYNTSKPSANQNGDFSIWKDMTVGGFLFIPIIVLLCSRSSLEKMKQALSKDYFNAVNNKTPGGFLNETAKHFRVFKTYIVDTVTSMSKPLRDKKDAFFQKLNAPENNTYTARIVKKINNFFIQRKVSTFNKKNQKVRKLFENLEKNLEKQIDVINASADGKVKVLFPASLRNSASDELPKVIDFSKTADGKNRANEIKKLLSEIKTLIGKEGNITPEIAKKISYSAEDIYKEANDTLISLFIDMRNKSNNYQLYRPTIKRIFEDFCDYRYAELFTNDINNTSLTRRQHYLKNILMKLKVFKTRVPEDSCAHVHLDKLEELVNHASKVDNAGLLEKIRFLLKCDDINSEFVKKGVKPSLFKYYQPDEYIRTKMIFNDFIKELKHLNRLQNKIVPLHTEEITNGKLYVHALATLVPALAIGGKAINSSNEVNKTKHKRNFYSFLVGSTTMLLAHNISVASNLRAIIYGALAALGTAKIYDKIKK